VKTDARRFRKRPYQAPGGKTALALGLREIGRDVSKRKPTLALSKANRILSDPHLDVWDQSRVLAQVADCEFMRGRFEKAARIHLQAAANCLDHHKLWLRPLLGHVRALLKVPQVDQALIMARHVVDTAESKMGNFDKAVSAANQLILENMAAIVPPLPPRVSVAATRMAHLFMQEGEPEIAREFFDRAIKASPGGANRAKQGLAKLALAQGDCKKALELSSEAIRQGKYKAKTLPAWPVMISARRQMGGWKISEKLVKGLDAAPAALRARTILTIVVELRKNDMRQWREVAKRWSSREGAQFPVIEAEIKKLVLASAKAEPGNATDKRAKAEQLLLTPGLSPHEWLSATKERVRASLWAGGNVNIQQLLAMANAKYGKDFTPKAVHSLALSCILAKRYALARPLLQANIQQLKVNNPQRGKSVWALARMESQQGDHATAARLFRQIFEDKATPIHFRLQAQLLWVEALVAAGQPGALLEARPLMSVMLRNVDNPDILMNFARQLRMSHAELSGFAAELFAQGEVLALKRFNEATHPDVALAILFKLTRRQVIDFDRSREAIMLWESFDAAKKDWLWAESSVFWEYMGLIFEAYVRSAQPQMAVQFARGLLDDPATPAQGVPYVGIPFARRLMEGIEPAAALDLFTRMTRQAPQHALCAWAWYWLALDAFRLGDSKRSKEFARNIRMVQGVHPGTLDQWNLDARALLLLADLDPSRIDAQAVNYDVALLKGQMEQISSDLAGLAR
jgi:tetratricopeptide (TPR) repeat protein